MSRLSVNSFIENDPCVFFFLYGTTFPSLFLCLCRNTCEKRRFFHIEKRRRGRKGVGLSQTFVSSLLLGHWRSWAEERDTICHVSAFIKAWQSHGPLVTPHQAGCRFMSEHLVRATCLASNTTNERKTVVHSHDLNKSKPERASKGFLARQVSSIHSRLFFVVVFLHCINRSEESICNFWSNPVQI